MKSYSPYPSSEEARDRIADRKRPLVIAEFYDLRPSL